MRSGRRSSTSAEIWHARIPSTGVATRWSWVRRLRLGWLAGNTGAAVRLSPRNAGCGWPAEVVLRRAVTRPRAWGLGTVSIARFALGVFLIAACSEVSAPKDRTCPTASVPLCLGPTLAVITAALTDAATRSLGAMGNVVAKPSLSSELGAVAEAIGLGNVTRATAALERARAAVAAAQQQLNVYPGDAPDLAAIELVLVQVDLAVK